MTCVLRTYDATSPPTRRRPMAESMAELRLLDEEIG
jgi:hypothetical protein